MKYEAEINGQTVHLELEEKDGRMDVVIAERRYAIEVAHPEAGVYQFFVGDKIYEARVVNAPHQAMEIQLRGQPFTVRLIDRKHRRAGAEHSDDSQQQLLAPMPGKVVRVLLNTGDEVKAGQGVVIVEAMKMQNEIKSPKDGHLLEVRVNEGDTVTGNQVLAVVE
ncbi:MAG: biotin/lipoyl-binding protein [Acidobacteria bacterium]|nr:biotin/lipoyl-binding protein [Acidobacteriota bacterium]